MASLSAAAASYESLLLHNATRISSIESSLRSLTWFLPGRFQDSELASEALYSALNILGLYHDTVLLRTISTLPSSVRPAPSSHARYTRHFTATSPLYRRLSRFLSILTYSELLLEMGVKKRRGGDTAEKVVIGVEGLKAVIRLVLMGKTKRTGVTPPTPEREVDPSVLDLHRPHLVVDANNDERISLEATGPQDDYWKGKRTGLQRPTLKTLRGETHLHSLHPTGPTGDSNEKVKAFLESRVLKVENARRAEDLVSKAKGLSRVAEIIWILRPLIYVLLIRKYGRRHTLPYLLSLSLEYLAYSLRTTAAARTASQKASGPMLGSVVGDAEQQETQRRARAFWWYLLRGPVWESWTKPQLQALSSRFENKPIVGFVSTLIGDYLPLIDDYYFYTS